MIKKYLDQHSLFVWLEIVPEIATAPRQRSAQFWDPSLERAFALLQLTMEDDSTSWDYKWAQNGIKKSFFV